MSIEDGRGRAARECTTPRERRARIHSPMNWNDLRFVLALSEAGSRARAAKVLKVDHTTVGRRIETLENALGVSLFTRTTSGYVPTAEAERLLPDLRHIEASMLAIERGAHARQHETLEGVVR